MTAPTDLEETRQLALQFEKRGGILPVIVQDHQSNEILMLGYTNQEAFNLTLSVGKAAFWSTSRKRLWVKGETSGNELKIKEILVDCDQDALIYKVSLSGEGSCHTRNSAGKFRRSCFYRWYDKERGELKKKEEG
ncbi:MAG TPA: phosphoribosyl-AMP cyclohydrolase [Balneolaceae bacterium]|nr:phosphoribosyl-AMP cyclohydrolase [Balneolaceae bacterium]